MHILVTSSRMPFALDEIRKLGKRGHHVIATDTFRNAPGSHSRYAAVSLLTSAPRYETRRFIAEIAQIVREEAVDLVLPAFEEAFYLARHRHELGAPVFAPPFETLAKLHDKLATIALARELSIEVPRTLVATSRSSLHHATVEIGDYLARPSFSRGGVQLFTNQGPLAGALTLEECDPSQDNPWLVQEYVDGTDVCTFSIAHRGKLTAHASYLHPREIEHAGGIVFESIVDDEALEYARLMAERTAYDGQISFDFRRTDKGLVLLECNPRPTAGVMMLTPREFDEALFDERASALRIAKPGIKKKYSVALVRDMVLHWREIPQDLKHLLSPGAREFYAEPGDALPALYSMLSYSHLMAYRRQLGIHKRAATDVMSAYFHDVLWDGGRIE
jgi:glutathione synthase/RimK-type ligase-like ATP-grasp enzyme